MFQLWKLYSSWKNQFLHHLEKLYPECNFTLELTLTTGPVSLVWAILWGLLGSRTSTPDFVYRCVTCRWERNIFISASWNFIATDSEDLLTMPKPLTVWITKNCGKFLKKWEYQTTLPASWEIYMQVKKQQFETDSVKLWTMPCRATQDGLFIVESLGEKKWSPGEGNGKPLSILALRTPWTVWKGKNTGHWKKTSPGQ